MPDCGRRAPGCIGIALARSKEARMTLRPEPFLCTLTVLFLAVGSTTAFGQEGTISGIVRDALGDPIAGVTVVATDQATKVPRSATSATDGRYSIALPPATYSVAAILAGFQRVLQVVQIDAGGSTHLDFELQPSLSQEITVTATKREQTVLDVPFSVAAPTAEVLRARGVEGIEGIAANVAGFTVQNLGPGQSQVAMRGISAGQIV